MKDEVAYGFVAVIMLSFLFFQPSMTGLGLWDPQPEVTLVHDTPVHNMSAHTRLYLKNYDIEVFRSRLYIPSGERNVPLPRLGEERYKITEELYQLSE